MIAFFKFIRHFLEDWKRERYHRKLEAWRDSMVGIIVTANGKCCLHAREGQTYRLVRKTDGFDDFAVEFMSEGIPITEKQASYLCSRGMRLPPNLRPPSWD